MTDRINKIIEYLGMTQVRFAEQIAVSPASLSHLQKGRNKPSLELVTHILETFPQISSDWLLFGTGEMLRLKEGAAASEHTPTQVKIQEVVKPVDHITIFYKDDTYCNFYPESGKG